MSSHICCMYVRAGRPAFAWPYIQQLCDDMGCNPEDLPEAMNDRETWRERVRDIRARHDNDDDDDDDDGLTIYHLFASSNSNFLHNSSWITLPSQPCLIL